MPRKNPHAVALGRKGGQASTPAKAAAARRNAQHAGRRPKFTPGDRVQANVQAPRAYRGRVGRITWSGPGRADYGVEFHDASAGTLKSWWLDRAD